MPFRIRVSLIIVASIVGAAGLLPLVWPIPPLENVAPARDVAGPDARWIEAGPLALHARFEGTDRGAIGAAFLHGFGSNLVSFTDVQEALAADVPTVAWDRPGFGLTERVVDGFADNPYTPEAQVGHVLLALDAAGIERGVLIGHSAGGAIALEAALAHPGRISGLVLIAPAVYRGGGAPTWSRWALRTPQMERIGPLLMRQLGGDPGERLLRSAYADPSRLRADVLEAYRRATRVEDWDRALWALVKASREPDLVPHLDAIDVPVLVIGGAQDAIVPIEQTRMLADAIEGATYAELEECGHVPQEECSGAVIAAIERWWTAELEP